MIYLIFHVISYDSGIKKTEHAFASVFTGVANVRETDLCSGEIDYFSLGADTRQALILNATVDNV